MDAAAVYVQPVAYKPHQVRVTAHGVRLIPQLGAADRFWLETAPAPMDFFVHFDSGPVGIQVSRGTTYRTDMAMCGSQILRFVAAEEFDLTVIVKVPAVV